MPGSTTSASRVSTVQSHQPEEHSQVLHVPSHSFFLLLKVPPQVQVGAFLTTGQGKWF